MQHFAKCEKRQLVNVECSRGERERERESATTTSTIHNKLTEKGNVML